jgi:hypothetical protein
VLTTIAVKVKVKVNVKIDSRVPKAIKGLQFARLSVIQPEANPAVINNWLNFSI